MMPTRYASKFHETKLLFRSSVRLALISDQTRIFHEQSWKKTRKGKYSRWKTTMKMLKGLVENFTMENARKDVTNAKMMFSMVYLLLVTQIVSSKMTSCMVSLYYLF